MGKNTVMKHSIRMHAERTGNQAYLNLMTLLVVCEIPECMCVEENKLEYGFTYCHRSKEVV
ncbi:hypothetical protein Mapa_010031 [Marchantia paleacea]|nr:hypothetical protein Mapa_010031 [Marchantia paleacea]